MTKLLGMLVYENTQPIDFIGPWEVFSYWKSITQTPIDMCLIAESGSSAQCMNNITINTQYNISNAPQVDLLLVPGGLGRLDAINNEKIISFIKKQAEKAEYVLAVCTGMFLLHKAGLLDDLAVTTYWRALPEARQLKNVTVHEDRIVKNKHIWTSGGISSGIDLALAFIKAMDGEEMAGKVQLLFEYFPENTVYCTPEQIHALPKYYVETDNATASLPKYIKDYLNNKK